MKRQKLLRIIKHLGWSFHRQGGRHEIWSNGQGRTMPIPRKKELKEGTARTILIQAEVFSPRREVVDNED